MGRIYASGNKEVESSLPLFIITPSDPLKDFVFSVPEILGSAGWFPKGIYLLEGSKSPTKLQTISAFPRYFGFLVPRNQQMRRGVTNLAPKILLCSVNTMVNSCWHSASHWRTSSKASRGMWHKWEDRGYSASADCCVCLSIWRPSSFSKESIHL